MKLRTNIRLSFEQWKFRKLQFFFLAVQIMVSFLLVCFIFQQFFSSRQLMAQMEKYMGAGDVYVLWNNNEPEWQQELENPKYNGSFRALTEEIRSTKADILVLNNEYETAVNEKSVGLTAVTPEFFVRYGIEGDFSMEDVEKEFQPRFLEDTTQEEILPVVAGDSFRRKYKKGDVVQGDGGEQYRIIGFLKKNASYAVPTQSRELENMNHTLLIPVTVDLSDNVSMMDYIRYSQFSVADRSCLLGIENKNRELRLMDAYFVSYRVQLEKVRTDILESIFLFGGFGGILFVFSILGIVGMVIQLIHDYQYEYAVNLMCGAELSDVFIRLVFQVSLFVLVGTVFARLVFGAGPAFWSAGAMAAVILAALYGYGFKRLKGEEIIMSLRGAQ